MHKMLLGGRVGDSWYVLSQAVAHLVNQNSEWLRLEVVATPGTTANSEIAMEDPTRYVFVSTLCNLKIIPVSDRYRCYDEQKIIGWYQSQTAAGYRLTA